MRSSIVVAGLAAIVAAQRPSNTSICDYYTTALLKENNATNQQILLTLVVNTAVIGNYTQPNVGVAVPGILTAGSYKGTPVNLLQYFDGQLDSTDNGSSSGISVNFLDGGGATPLMNNMPANNTNSAQYFLLTHLYEYFAGLLGCSLFGNTTSPYGGDTSMYEVHKYMALGEAEFAYFVEQVGLSAASFGVASSDVDAVGTALMTTFGYRCSGAEAIPPNASPALQAICIDSTCPSATTSADCGAYAPVVTPMNATMTGSATMTMTGSGSVTSATEPATMTSATESASMTMTMMTGTMTTAPTSTFTGAAGAVVPVISSLGVGIFGLFALFL